MHEFFHYAQKCSDKEIVATELPGELWVKIFESENPQALFDLSPDLSNTQTDTTPIISVSKFMGVFLKRPQDVRCQFLMPYIQEAMDLGYEYLMLTQ